MANVREILDEVFSLMQLQILASGDSAYEIDTEDYAQRAERIDELLNLLVDKGPRDSSMERRNR
jgi:hypothetical protein